MIAILDLFADFSELNALELDNDDLKVSAICGAIQDCCDGCLFVADLSETTDLEHTGDFIDGADLIAQAIYQGAKVIITRPDVDVSAYEGSQAYIIQIDNPLKYLGPLAARFYNYERPAFVAAVTGTNGKTSCTNLAAQLFDLAELKSFSIGNIGVHEAGRHFLHFLPAQLSVPETVEIHRMLSSYKQQGAKALFFEATSHALHDMRFEGMQLEAAAFTNITQDHLDFHRDMDEYFAQKMRLFDGVLKEGGTAIINADMDRIEQVRERCKENGYQIIEFGYNAPESDLKLLSYAHMDQGLQIELIWQGQREQLSVPLMGEFNAYNLLCAIAFTQVHNIPKDVVLSAADQIEPVKGRLEFVASTQDGGQIYIDYAHSPDALEQLLKSAKERAQGRIIVLFNCNGDRDTDKRKVMGSIASTYADISFVTDGFCRSESAAEIRKEVLAGFKEEAIVKEVAGRENAIMDAINELQSTDHLYVVGMGHEKWHGLNQQLTTDKDMILNNSEKQALVS